MRLTERTWEITDSDGSNKRRVTLAQYRAEIETAKKLAMETLRAEAAKLEQKSCA